MQIPSLGNIASAVTGAAQRTAKEPSSANEVPAAHQQRIEQVEMSESVGDRDAHERYEGPDSDKEKNSRPANESPMGDNPLLGLDATDAEEPPTLDLLG